MATGIREEAVNFVASHMKKNPSIEMSALQELGYKKGINVYPLILGLARKKLGIKKPKPTGPKRKPGRPKGSKNKPKPAGMQALRRRGPGRPRKSVNPEDAIGNVITHMRALEDEVESMREALRRIAELAGQF